MAAQHRLRHGRRLAHEMVRESANGPISHGTDLTILGLTVREVPSPGVGEAMVADTSRCYGVVRFDARIDVVTTRTMPGTATAPS